MNSTKQILKLAKEKILAYQDHFGMEYPGGLPIDGLMRMINNELKATSDSTAKIKSAKELCEIYFKIAADEIGEKEVRLRRDKIIKCRT